MLVQMQNRRAEFSQDCFHLCSLSPGSSNRVNSFITRWHLHPVRQGVWLSQG